MGRKNKKLTAETGRVKVEDISLTSYSFSILARHKMKAWEPFVGIGFSINDIELGKATLADTTGAVVSQSGTSPGSDSAVGYHVTGGLNYKIGEQVSLYGEFKYTQSDFTVDNFDNTGVDVEFDLSSHVFQFGASYSF